MIRKIFIIFCISLNGILLSTIDYSNVESHYYNTQDYLTSSRVEYLLDNHSLIAHAGGGIDSITYSNSKEAIDFHYQSGTRLFEIDFMFSKDKEIVAVHYWQDIREDLSYYNRLNKDEFIQENVYGKYQTLSLEDIFNLMSNQYKDMILILDTKESDCISLYKKIINEAKTYDKYLLKRIIPQVYSLESLNEIKNIYLFDNYILTLYKMKIEDIDVYNYLKNNSDIKLLTMSHHRYRNFDKTILELIKNLDVRIYIHTINDKEILKKLLNDNIQGIYTDYIIQSELE